MSQEATGHRVGKAIRSSDPHAYEDIYFESQDAEETAPGAVSGLFAALGLIAINHSGAAGGGGAPEQAATDVVHDAVFANAGACTAEDVTLRL